MQIILIETFLDLMETRNFNRTAERLNITQSTVTHRINALEAMFARKLFARNKGGTQPTAAGLRFLDHAKALQHQWHEATRAVETARQVRFKPFRRARETAEAERRVAFPLGERVEAETGLHTISAPAPLSLSHSGNPSP